MERLWSTETNITMREALEPVVPIVVRLTHLGDGALLIVLAVLIYWFGARTNRRDRAFVIAIGVAALALSVGLKGIFQLPRPVLAFTPVGYPGYTFPSAHATGAAAFYGALAVTMRTGTRLHRYLIAGGVIGVVALSRVVLGVHFFGDVVVGVLLGLGLVWLGLRWRQEGEFAPGVIFSLAAGIALVSAVLGSPAYLTIALGAALGGAVGWSLIENRTQSERGAAILVTGAALLVGLLAARVVFIWLGSIVPGAAPDPGVLVLETLTYAVLTGLVLAVPVLATTIEQHPIVASIERWFPFQGRQLELEEPVRS